ncbi:MAG TPA: DUF4129 domain-containing protein [Thermoanaerobaculia bacterium]|jgi:hypothetical protein|nr:DUF4129 domain-containing protein [Thermoanaerobaculia bacterium]
MSIRSRRSSTDGLALLLAAGLCLGSAAVRAQEMSQETVRAKARAVLGQGYQKDLPDNADDEGGEGSGGSHMPPGLSQPPGDSRSRVSEPAIGKAFSLLMWATLGMLGVAGLVLLLTWILRDLPSRGRRSKARSGPAKPGAPDRPDTERGPGPSLADAERLAIQERWTEAVHLLLLVAIRHLTTRFSIPQAASRTSREIARLLPLQRETSDAFAGLVRTVEISLFGGVPVGPDEYRASLESVRRLLGSAS